MTDTAADLPPIPQGRDSASVKRSPGAALGAVLSDLPLLECVADRLQPFVDGLLQRAGKGVNDVLHGRPIGHALHPALSDLPIGLWAGSLVCDATGQPEAAGTLTAAGTAAAAATALTGWADWTGAAGRERRLALLHGLVNSAGIGLQVASLVARAGGRRGAAVALSAGGFVVTGASAWVGGELVLGHGLGVDHTAWLLGPADWTDVGALTDLPVGEIRPVEVESRTVLLHRDADGVHALEDTCSHAGGPLHEGEVAGGTITCPWHASCFRLRDGAVVGGPATYPQPLLQARVHAGRIEVRGREEV